MKNFLWDLLKYIPNKIIPALLGFLTLPILTRIFSTEDFGEYSLCLATISVLTILVTWVNQSNIRFFHHYDALGQKDDFIINNLILGLISIVLASAFYLVILLLFKNNISQSFFHLLLITCANFILLSTFLLLQNFLRIQSKVLTFSTYTVLNKIIAFFTGLALVYLYSRDISMMLWGAVISQVILLPIVFRSAIELKTFKFILSKPISKQLFSYGLPLVISNIAAWVLTLSSRYQLSIIRSNEDVGIYSAGTSVSDHSILLISQLILLAAYPIGVKIFENKGEKAAALFEQRVTGIFLCLSLPAVIGFITVSKLFFRVFMGVEFYQGFVIIPFVVFGSFFFGLQQRFQSGLLYKKQTKYITRSTVIAAITNIITNYFLISYFGYIGAAIGNCFSYLILLILVIIYSNKFFHWRFPFEIMIISLFGSGIMSLSIIAFDNISINSQILKLILEIIIAVFVYSTTVYVLIPKRIINTYKETFK